MPPGGLRLSFKSCSRSRKALDRLGQRRPRLRRLSPDVAGNFNRVRIVVAATRDASNLRPALKGERDGRAAGRAEVNEDFLLAAVRDVRIAAQRPCVEHHGTHGEDRFGVVRRPCHALAKGAMARKRTQRRLRGSESNFSAEAAAFDFFGHVAAFQ